MAMDARDFALSREKNQSRAPDIVAFEGSERFFHISRKGRSRLNFLVQDLHGKPGTTDLETFDA